MRHRDSYFIDAVLRACDVLQAFQNESESLRLTEVAHRTGLSKATAYRFLVSLESRGFIRRPKPLDYSRAVRLPQTRRFRIGFAAQTTEFSFSRDVTESVIRAAASEAVDLVVLDNHYSPRIALHNVDAFIQEKLDLVIEFQTDGRAALAVATKLEQCGIPMIAVEIPHPGAIYYGAQNYEAGLMGGRYLGRWAKAKWQGQVDEILMLDLAAAGSVPRGRLAGMLDGIQKVVGSIPESSIKILDGNGRFARSLEVVRKHLRKSKARHVLVGGVNDPSAIGALRAFQEVGGESACAVMGQNASIEARTELRSPGSRLIGSVAFFPEKYGENLIALALSILNRRNVPPAVYTKHTLITAQNVDYYYPNDPAGSAAALH